MSDQKYDVLKLDNQICFPLYACSREIIKQYKPFLDELDLTYTQYIAMLVLWEKGHLTVKELGERLFLDSGTLTPMLKKMESKGLLTRTRSMQDERNLIITISKKGESLKERAVSVPGKMAKRANLSLEDAQALYRIFRKMLNKTTPNTICGISQGLDE